MLQSQPVPNIIRTAIPLLAQRESVPNPLRTGQTVPGPSGPGFLGTASYVQGLAGLLLLNSNIFRNAFHDIIGHAVILGHFHQVVIAPVQVTVQLIGHLHPKQPFQLDDAV